MSLPRKFSIILYSYTFTFGTSSLFEENYPRNLIDNYSKLEGFYFHLFFGNDEGNIRIKYMH